MQVYSLIYAEFTFIFKNILSHKSLTNLLNYLTPYYMAKNLTSYYIQRPLPSNVKVKLTLSEYME